VNKKEELVNRLVNYLKNYPEEWFNCDSRPFGVRHKSKITIYRHRFGGVSVSLTNDYGFTLQGSLRKKLNTAILKWRQWAIEKHEADSINAILKALLDVKGRDAIDIAQKKINGDM
jgi:hypothetical protein